MVGLFILFGGGRTYPRKEEMIQIRVTSKRNFRVVGKRFLPEGKVTLAYLIVPSALDNEDGES
jgi:hypothetical protein